MSKIDKHISDLLYCYDCVVVPEFGGFITNYEPAKVDRARKLVHPPSKSILFNKNIQTNDGLLASKIAQEEQITYEDSNRKIQASVADWRTTLQEKGRLELENIGVLYQDDEANIRFIQANHNYLTSSFGLPRVDFIPVEKPVEKKTEEKVVPVVQLPVAPKELPEEKEAPKVIPIQKKEQPKTAATKVIVPKQQETDGSKRRGFGYWAAAVMIPLFLAYGGLSFWNSGMYYSGEFQTAALNPLNWFSSEQNYATRPVVIEMVDDTVSETVVDKEEVVEIQPVPVVEEYEEIIPEAETTHVEIAVDEVLDQSYYVIGGCFSKEKNANHFIEEMEKLGFDAEIIGMHKGLHRVSIGGASSRKEAKAIREDAQNQDVSCWILKN